MKFLVISNGQLNNINILKEISQKVDYIICADGGIRYSLKANIIPDIIIGDLDSAQNDLLKKIGEKAQFIKYPVQKDKTDTELAIEYAIQKGAKEIILLGATGTRLDHTIANIMLLYKLLKLGIKGTIIDSHNEIYIIDKQLTLKREEGTFVSVIPLSQDLLGVTLKGFEYEIEKLNFGLGSTLGISNSIIDEEGKIEIEKGLCLVIRARD